MTISTTGTRQSYNGNGFTKNFAFPYRFLANADLKVVLVAANGTETLQVLNTNYTVSGVGSDSGGTVSMIVAPPSGSRLVVYRDMILTQEIDYITGDPFPAETHEQGLDRLTMISQQQKSVLDRAVVTPVTEFDNLDMTLPKASDRATTVLAFDESGEPVVGPTIAAVGTVSGNIVNVNTVATNINNVNTTSTLSTRIKQTLIQ